MNLSYERIPDDRERINQVFLLVLSIDKNDNFYYNKCEGLV